MRTILAAILGAFLVSAAAAPALASKRDEAEAAVEAQITRLGIDRARIKSVYLGPVGHSQDSPVQSYTGWISFTDCRGNLVIDLSQTNAVRSIYTTGDCTVPGVR